MSAHIKSSLGGKTTQSKKEAEKEKEKEAHKQKTPIPEPELTEEQEKKLKGEVSLEYKEYQADQRALIASQKRRDVDKLNDNPPKRDRSRRRHRSPISKVSKSARRAGYVSLGSSSASSSQELNPKKAARSAISAPR